MITSYVIKDNILYLYVDYGYEFSYIDLKNNIKEYIKNKKIIFTGSTIAIVVGGFIIGNIALNNDDKKDIISSNISYEYTVPTNNKMIDLINKKNIIDISNNKINVDNKLDNNKEDNINSEMKENNISGNASNSRNNNTNLNSNIQNNYTSIFESNKENNNNTQANVEINDNVKVEDNTQEEIDNNIYVNVNRMCRC